MNPALVFNIWAPHGGLWSDWAKPILFAHLRDIDTEPLVDTLAMPVSVDWAPAAWENVALVVDLPQVRGVTVGTALAQRGYRPVPLYNACPGPRGTLVGVPAGVGSLAMVDVTPIALALAAATSSLRETPIARDAPPAFLLDANRRFGQGPPDPGRFDNRSVSFPTDFPSANFLLAHRVSRVILVQEDAVQPQPDLAHTLLRWEQAGVKFEYVRLEVPGPALPLRVSKPSMFGAIWYRLTHAMNFRRAPLGGFGGILPSQSSG